MSAVPRKRNEPEADERSSIAAASPSVEFALNVSQGRGLLLPAQKRSRSSSASAEQSRSLPYTLSPMNRFCVPLLTDKYQITMAYAYWKSKMHLQPAVFDLFFRKCPFKGHFAVFAGLEEVMRFVDSYRFTAEQVDHVRTLLPDADEGFFEWLAQVDCSQVRIYAMKEGSVCFPRIPLLRVEGPVAICQLLETPLLCLVNYATLIATNAARLRMAAPNKTLLEFGLRRAQGPDGALSGSRYAYMGGCDGTSNVLAGALFDIKCSGTMAHSFVTSFGRDHQPSAELTVRDSSGQVRDFVRDCFEMRQRLGVTSAHDGELHAFVAYASAYPSGFLALVDTYDTLASGVRNFVAVAATLHQYGYRAQGVRLDSGDLAYLSTETRALFRQYSAQLDIPYLAELTIVASNDINEETLLSLAQQGHEIDVFGIGTNLITCQSQPALGAVFKLVQINDKARIKLSEDISKVTLPARKDAYRLFSSAKIPVVDLLVLGGSEPPAVGERILCQHPFIERKRAFVVPSQVEPLHELVWDGPNRVVYDFPSMEEIRLRARESLKHMRKDHLRPLNPTPYKVSVSKELYDFTHSLWMTEAPIRELS